jgi:hypothetical protein
MMDGPYKRVRLADHVSDPRLPLGFGARGCYCGLLGGLADFHQEEEVGFDELTTFWIGRIELCITLGHLSDEELAYHVGYQRALQNEQHLARTSTSRGGVRKAAKYRQMATPFREIILDILQRQRAAGQSMPTRRALRDAAIDAAMSKDWFPPELTAVQVQQVQTRHPEIDNPVKLRKTRAALEAVITLHMVDAAIATFKTDPPVC